MTIRQHLPNFVEGDPMQCDVFTAMQMLGLPFVARWNEQVSFDHFAKMKYKRELGGKLHDGSWLLMAVMKKDWWVIAHCSGEDAEEILKHFPIWEPKVKI